MQEKSTEQSVDSLLLWVDQNIREENSDSLFKYANVALDQARRLEDPEKIGNAHSTMAKMHRALANYDSVLFHAQQSLIYHEEAGMSFDMANDYLDIGYAYGNKLSLLNAEESILKAVEIFETFDAKSNISQAYGLLAYFFYLSETFEDGLKYIELSYSNAIAARDTMEMIDALTIYTPLYIALGKPTEALSFANQSVELINIYKQSTLVQNIDGHYYRGKAYKELNRLEEAMQNFIVAYKLAKERWKKSEPETALFYTDGIAHIQQLNGDYESAIKTNERLLDHLYETGEFENLIETHKRLSQCYEAVGQYDKALIQGQLAWNLEDSVKTLRYSTLSSELQIRYETASREQTILEQQSQIDRQQRIQYLIIGIAALSVLLLFVLFYYYRHNKQRNQELSNLNDSLSEKNLQNETLLKEIHHRVKNNLEIVSSLLELQSAQLDDADQQEALQSSQSRIQSMGIVHQKLYRENGLSTIEMGDYFMSLSDHILDAYNARDKVEIQCKMDPIQLDLDTAIPIGLIVNELLTNALKHAFPSDQKGKIEISLQEAPDGNLTLIVADNGVGKTKMTASKDTGFGTQLISLLTKQLNGEMREEISKGTTISFKLTHAHS